MPKKKLSRPALIAAAKEKFTLSQVRNRFGLGGMDWTQNIDVWKYLTTRPEKGEEGKKNVALEAYLQVWHRVGKHLFTEEEKTNFECEVAVRYLLTAPSHPIHGESARNLDFLHFLRFNCRCRIYDCGEAGYLVEYQDPTQSFILLQGKNTHLQPADFVRHFAKYFAEGRDDLCEMKEGVDFIFQRLGETVGDTIASAKKTFAEACAVSLDGHSVTVADTVHLVGKTRVRICSASLFLKDKIEKPFPSMRLGAPKDIDYAVKLVRGGQQAIFLQENEDSKRLFIVQERFAPPDLLQRIS